MEKTLKHICQVRNSKLSPEEKATAKTFLRNFCEENEVKAFLYIRLFLVCIEPVIGISPVKMTFGSIYSQISLGPI